MNGGSISLPDYVFWKEIAVGAPEETDRKRLTILLDNEAGLSAGTKMSPMGRQLGLEGRETFPSCA